MLRIKNLIVLVLTICFVFSVSQAQTRRPSRFLIPEGYAGWVRIDFRVANAPPLPIEDGHYLFKIPNSGRLETSSDLEGGTATDQFFLYSGDKRTELEFSGDEIINEIWGFSYDRKEVRVANSEKRKVVAEYQYFFVGTEDEYIEYGRIIGNVRKKENKN